MLQYILHLYLGLYFVQKLSAGPFSSFLIQLRSKIRGGGRFTMLVDPGRFASCGLMRTDPQPTIEYTSHTTNMLDLAKDDSSNLKFDVAAPPEWEYAPGDTIIGHLIRHVPTVTPEATLTVWLEGEMSTGLEEYGNKQFSQKGTWNLVEHAEDIIFMGPLDINEKSDSFSCPFSIPIPFNPPARPWKPLEGTFLPQESYRDHDLPPSFYSYDPGAPPPTVMYSNIPGIPASQAVIEYALQARLQYTVGSSHEDHRASFPIRIRQVPNAFALKSELRRHLSRPVYTQSYRLLPGHADEKPSLLKQTKRVFSATPTPVLALKLALSLPGAIQLDSKEPIPIQLRVIPLPRDSHSVAGLVHTVQINSIKLFLEHQTVILVNPFYSSTTTPKDQLASFDLKLPSLDAPLVTSTDADNEPIDLGAMFNLVLRSNGTAYSGGKLLTPYPKAVITPDFTTYLVKHTHRLKFQMHLSVAGEDQVVDTYAPVEIAGPS